MSSSFTMHTPRCGYCHRLKSQLDREGIAFDIVDIEQDRAPREIVESANNGNQTVPTLVYSDGDRADQPVARRRSRPSWRSWRAPESSPVSPH